MKKLIISTLLVIGIFAQSVHAMQDEGGIQGSLRQIGKWLGYESESVTGSPERGQRYYGQAAGTAEERIHFWQEIVDCFQRKGYGEDTYQMKHARQYLQRAHTEAKQQPLATRQNIMRALSTMQRPTETRRTPATPAARRTR